MQSEKNLEVAGQEQTLNPDTTTGANADITNQQGQERITQTPEQNKAFAEMRRAKEEAERQAKEVQKQLEYLANATKKLGYDGDPITIADTLIATTDGLEVDEVKRQREYASQEAERQRQEKELSEMRDLKLAEYMMKEDLREIQSLRPFIKSLEELPEEFWKLKEAGVSVSKAIEVVVPNKPKDAGGLNGTTPPDKDYYTPDEIDRLSPNDLNDKNVLDRAWQSLFKK
jgi:hypothetical protein